MSLREEAKSLQWPTKPFRIWSCYLLALSPPTLPAPLLGIVASMLPARWPPGMLCLPPTGQAPTPTPLCSGRSFCLRYFSPVPVNLCGSLSHQFYVFILLSRLKDVLSRPGHPISCYTSPKHRCLYSVLLITF